MLSLLDRLGEFSGEADRELGTKEIDGKPAQGFEIDVKRIDRDSYPEPVEIWVDVETKLPALLRLTLKPSGVESTMSLEGFQWNIALAPGLFEPTAPEGSRQG